MRHQRRFAPWFRSKRGRCLSRRNPFVCVTDTFGPFPREFLFESGVNSV